VALLLVAASCGSDNEVAEVADESLTVDELVDLVEEADEAANDNVAEAGGDVLDSAALDALTNGTLDKAEAAGAITTWARNEVWYAELADRGYTVGEADFDAARDELEQIALTDPSVPDLDSSFGEEIVRSQALPGLVENFLVEFEQIDFVWPVQMCSSHILLDTEEEALAAIERLDAGEDFAALAAELSTGPSGPGGGDLGCVDPASFVVEFVEGAALVDPPGVSAPVQSEFGWHVIEVRSFDATPSEDPAVIQNAVFPSAEFIALQASVLAREVTINPIYGTWDTESFLVVPAVG
jgi:parvulin-like peptidyl-prolyl isomerase